MIHLVGLPHTETTRAFDWCAYTAKTRKFATMMTNEGHDVTLYAGEANDADCKEHVPLVTRAEQAVWFAGYDWARDAFSGWEPSSFWWQTMNMRAIREIATRCEPGDILGLIAGRAQQPIALAFPDLLAVEWGIGYEGVFAPYRVFESHAWAHHVAGVRKARGDELDDFRPHDTVIPNFFELDDFPLGTGGDYLLYIGRLTERKGLAIVEQTQQATGLPLIVAGQGDPSLLDCPHEYAGVVGAQERARLMGGALALLAPTIYLEPFGGVAVEAQLCGTPAITTDWGAFTETVEPRFRARTLDQFLAAVDRAAHVDRNGLRGRALSLYSTDVIGPQFARYFSGMIDTEPYGRK